MYEDRGWQVSPAMQDPEVPKDRYMRAVVAPQPCSLTAQPIVVRMRTYIVPPGDDRSVVQFSQNLEYLSQGDEQIGNAVHNTRGISSDATRSICLKARPCDRADRVCPKCVMALSATPKRSSTPPRGRLPNTAPAKPSYKVPARCRTLIIQPSIITVA